MAVKGKRMSYKNRNVVSVRVTDEELEAIRASVDASGTRVSDLLKDVFRSYIEQYRLPDAAEHSDSLQTARHDRLSG